MAQDKATRPQGEANVSDALATGAADLDAALSRSTAAISGYIPAESSGDASDAGSTAGGGSATADRVDDVAVGDLVADESDAGIPGEELTRDVAEQPPFEVVDDEAEELDELADDTLAATPDVVESDPRADEGELDDLEHMLDESDEVVDEADSSEVEIDDPQQLADAEAVAVAATSTRPMKRVRPKVKDDAVDIDAEARGDGRPVRKPATTAPVRKDKKTPARKDTAPSRTRTTPVQFVRESVAELRKVVWPTGTQVQQYFVVVLIFVLFIIAFVGLLDLGLGWLLLKLLG